MLRFLRKIRLRLLQQPSSAPSRNSMIDSQSDRKLTRSTGRYILFAGGEIVLIVLGILIAFQVNEWGNERSQNKKELETLNLMLEDLRDDEDNLEVFARRLNRQEAAVSYVLTEIHNNFYPDSLEYYAGEALTSWNYRPAFSTFFGLSQDGNLDLISDPVVRDEIIDFHSLIVPYLDDLRDKYHLLHKQATDALLPYFGYARDKGGDWTLRATKNIRELRADETALNTLAAAGEIRSWLTIRINSIFLVENRKLQQEILDYLSTFSHYGQ